QLSNIYDKNNDSKALGDNYNSFYIGLFAEKKLIPLLKLDYGIEYNSTGFRDESLAGVNTDFTRHNLAIPVNLKLKLGPVFAMGGVAPSFGLSTKSEIGGVEFDTEPELFDAPVFLGAGVKIMMLSIEARYHWGTRNMTKIDGANTNQRYFQIGAALSF
ncbi:MAG: hypothetical protein ACPGD5_06735, partial [Salibacteraceae bacterium]